MARSRFDFVQYDSTSVEKSAKVKEGFKALESLIVSTLGSQETHYKHRCMDALEEAFMFCGKMIRDQQLDSRGGAVT